jgi:hypothetical protein
MGSFSSKFKKKKIPGYDKFNPIRIASIYADINESINKSKKINTIVEYFLKKFYGYDLDVLCIQGIKTPKIMREILKTFKIKINKYNDENYNFRLGYESAIYLEYFPDIEFDEEESNNMYWSTSENGDDYDFFDKIIITRHTILQQSNIIIETVRENDDNHSSKILSNDTTIIRNDESDDYQNVPTYVQCVNINVNGTFMSIYNIELEDDNIGINNKSIRKKQLFELRNIIEDNRRKIFVNQDLRKFINGDHTYLACNRDLHIVTGMFHINEYKNNIINSEYTKSLDILSSIDIHKWIASLKKDNDKDNTNIRMTRDSYIYLCSENVKRENDIQKKSMLMFKNHKLVITSSNIMKNQVDMNQFNNYPLDVLFMVFKPDISIYRSSNSDNFKNHNIFEERNYVSTTLKRSSNSFNKSLNKIDSNSNITHNGTVTPLSAYNNDKQLNMYSNSKYNNIVPLKMNEVKKISLDNLITTDSDTESINSNIEITKTIKKIEY